MTNEVHYVTGPVMFANVFEFNKKVNEYTDEAGEFTLDVGVDKDFKKTVKSWSKLYRFKEAEDYGEDYQDGCVDGVEYVTFKRKAVIRDRKGNVLDKFSGPPKVIDKDGKEWPEDTHIGNGSVCTVKLNVYKGVATDEKGKRIPYTQVRLDGIRVEELVEFKPSGGDAEEPEVHVHSDEIPF